MDRVFKKFVILVYKKCITAIPYGYQLALSRSEVRK